MRSSDGSWLSRLAVACKAALIFTMRDRDSGLGEQAARLIFSLCPAAALPEAVIAYSLNLCPPVFNLLSPMKPEQSSVSLVLLGVFQPVDFSLQRFHEAKLLGEAELANVTYELLVPGQAMNLLLPWGKFSIVAERLSIETTQVPYVRVCDMAMKLLREVSPSAMVAKLGINLTAHFKFADAATRDRFASRLVPPEAWGSHGEAVRKSFSESGDRHGGVMRVTMRQARPPDRSTGWLDVTVEPSTQIATEQGVAITLNDHYELSKEDLDRLRGNGRAVSEELLNTLASSFDLSVERSLGICEELTKVSL